MLHSDVCWVLQTAKRLDKQVTAIEDAEIVTQVGVSLHLDPPVAHTVNIEPLTPADWESKSVSC